MLPRHDQSYKALFSHPQMIRDLLKGFVCEDWVKKLDFGSLEKVNSSYVSHDLRERHDDVVWKVKFRKRWLYVYILIEFQSTVDPFMAVRLLGYVALLYQDLIKSRRVKPGQNLPPVLPIVLYNGERRWSAATNLSALQEKAPDSLARFSPQMEYLLIDEGAHADAELATLKNLVAAIFRLENDASLTTLSDVAVCLVNWLKSPNQAELRREIAGFLNLVYFDGRPYAEAVLAKAANPEEVKAMLAQQVEKMQKALIRKGLQRGLSRGRKLGLEKGRKLGIAEGEKLGIAEGEKLGTEKAKLALARNLLAEGLEIPLITRATGLSVDEIEKLKSDP